MFKHKDIKIEMAPSSGEFTATVNGMFVRKPSLAAMRKHIDEASKVQFKPFTALTSAQYHDKEMRDAPGYCRVRVVGVCKSQHRFSRHENCFLVVRPQKNGSEEGPSETTHALYEDTPENIALLREEDKAIEAKNAADTKASEEIQRIRKMQKTISPDSYAKTKKGV